MKNPNVRKAKGYCCVMCNGPYSVWLKTIKRSHKRTDQRIALKDTEAQLEQIEKEEP